MKIRHNIKRVGTKLVGQVLETIFEDGEEIWKCIHSSMDGKFTLRSFGCPELTYNSLYVYGIHNNKNKVIIKFDYESMEMAEKVMRYINEFTLPENNTFVQWEYVYVSNASEEEASKWKLKRIFLTKISETYICVNESSEKDYKLWNEYRICCWDFAVPIPKEEKKLRELYLTDSEFNKLNSLIQ